MEIDEQNELRNYAGPDRVVLSSDYWELIKNDKPPLKHMTGFRSLDQAIDGFESGEVIVVTGPTAMGKTTFCRSVMTQLASWGKRSLFFTFENDPRRIAAEHRNPQEALYMPMDHKPMNLHWLEKRCLEAALKYPDLSAIFIDHLHYVIDMAGRNNMSLEIGSTMRFLKQNLAVALGLPVFIVAHMTKILPDDEPNMSHLRDSALIACEADTVLVLWRRLDLHPDGSKLDTMHQNLATLKVEKARRVGTMGRKIDLKKDGLRLVEE
jgi:replicative DNA helicase